MAFYVIQALLFFFGLLIASNFSPLQCGQGTNNDQLRPTCVSSLLGKQVERVAAGLWHTICITVEGHVYAFGGNQFGQLGTGVEQAEVYPINTPLIKKLGTVRIINHLHR